MNLAFVGFRFQEFIEPAAKLRLPTTGLRQAFLLRQ
jgi:hypothetical protein